MKLALCQNCAPSRPNPLSRLGHQVWMIILLVLVLGLAIAFPTPTSHATPLCRQLQNHRICILDIKRSAKNYWEYRAVVKIDDQRQPKAVYNCRDRIRTMPQTGQVLPFEPVGAGMLICRLLHR